MEQPLVSVLMCSFNREKYIAEAIDSVLDSTYKNFELIIVDNCSEDRTFEIVQKYQLLDPRIRIYKNSSNIGQFPNRNKAAQLARGKYLKYLDSDDKLFKDGLKTMVEAMEIHPEAGLGVSYYFKNEMICEDELPKLISSQEAFEFHYLKGGLLFPGPSFTIYRSELFFRLKGFQQEFGTSADTHLNLMMASLAPVSVFKNNTTYWRIHPGQLTSNQKKIELDVEKYKLDKEILGHPSCPLSIGKREEILKLLKIINARNLICKYLIKFQISNFRRLRKTYNIKFYYLLMCLIPGKLKINRA